MDEEATVLAAFAKQPHHDGSTLIDVLARAAGDENYGVRSRRDYRDQGEAILKALQDRGLLFRDNRGWWKLTAGVVPMRGPGCST